MRRKVHKHGIDNVSKIFVWFQGNTPYAEYRILREGDTRYIQPSQLELSIQVKISFILFFNSSKLDDFTT